LSDGCLLRRGFLYDCIVGLVLTTIDAPMIILGRFGLWCFGDVLKNDLIPALAEFGWLDQLSISPQHIVIAYRLKIAGRCLLRDQSSVRGDFGMVRRLFLNACFFANTAITSASEDDV
jgi:hypothetical protein